MSTYPTLHSIPAPLALAGQLLPDYGLTQIAAADYFGGGFNDTYRFITSTGQVYYLRLYRQQWRGLSDVRYEIDLLLHLQARGLPAMRPVARLDGEYYSTLACAEGRRYALLSAELPGSEVSYEAAPVEMARRYGQAVAGLHRALDDFASPHPRVALDLEYLLDQPLRLTTPLLAHRPDDLHFLQQLVAFLRANLEGLGLERLAWGPCHGDLQGYHAKVAPDGSLAFYDFDCGGPGYRAYELAVFRWVTRLQARESLAWPAYLESYLARYPLAEMDLQALPYFTACRYTWHLGVHAENSYDWGIGFLNDEYYNNKLAQLRQLAQDEGWDFC